MVGLNGSLLHRLSRIEQLVPVVRAPAETFEHTVWSCWPRVLRCYLATTDWIDRGNDLDRIVALATAATVGRADEEATTIAIAATILHQAIDNLTWRLIRVSGTRTWSYSCPERDEAAQTLLDVDAPTLNHLTDDELVQAWSANFPSVGTFDVLEPAALSLLEATIGDVSPDECPHAGGHDQVPSRYLQVAFEQPCLASIRSAFLSEVGS